MGPCDSVWWLIKPSIVLWELRTEKTFYGAVLPPSQMVFFLEREKGMTEWYIRYQSCFDCEFSEQKKMAEWYIRGSSSSHQLITLDSDSFPPLLIRFLWWSWWSWGRSWWGMCGWVWVWWRSGWRSGSGSRSNDSQSISSLARAAAVAFALFGAGLLYYEHLNRFMMVTMITTRVMVLLIMMMIMIWMMMMMSNIYISVGYAEQRGRRPSLDDWWAQTWYLSYFLHQQFFQHLEFYPKKTRKSLHF